MNTLVAVAEQWTSIGVSPIPVIFKSKQPAIQWRLWQDHIPPKKILMNWFERGDRNIGVVCGGKSNLAILDFDDIGFYRTWYDQNVMEDTLAGDVCRNTYRVMTPRGMHLYLTTDKPEHSRKIPEHNLDIRCKGNYTLVPPSVHPSGKTYEPIGTVDKIMHITSTEDLFPIRKVYMPKTEDFEIDLFTLASRYSSAKDVKEKVPVLRFVQGFTRVIRTSADGRWYMAKCIHPSHNDHHPSFRIDTKNNRAKCLTATCPLYHDIGYDVIDMYSIIYNVTVADAIKELSLAFP